MGSARQARVTRPVAVAGCLAALLAASPSARAQGFAPTLTGDAGEPTYDRRFEPIRRGMLVEVPAGGAAEGPCENREGGTGQWRLFEPRMATTASFQTMRSVSLSPRLSLVGFSRGGCAFDGVAGGAMVFAQPLARGFSLLLSAGAMYAPHYGPGGTGVFQHQARVDVVTPTGLAVGVAASRAGPRVTVTGVW
ncbi:MAG: hypothetical protein JNL38_18720 [Myxococcales bacterium]|jgi:hypothetical protein|nr:hypothetical protein [Myxococcales bacterium]